jgi:hypothetical protein
MITNLYINKQINQIRILKIILTLGILQSTKKIEILQIKIKKEEFLKQKEGLISMSYKLH